MPCNDPLSCSPRFEQTSVQQVSSQLTIGAQLSGVRRLYTSYWKTCRGGGTVPQRTVVPGFWCDNQLCS